MSKDVFQAIADPTRREIVNMLSSKPLNLNDISTQFGMSRPGVVKHINVLKESGLLVMEKKGREQFCHVQLDKLGEIALWVHQYRRFWNTSLDQLEILLQKDADKESSKN